MTAATFTCTGLPIPLQSEVQGVGSVPAAATQLTLWSGHPRQYAERRGNLEAPHAPALVRVPGQLQDPVHGPRPRSLSLGKAVGYAECLGLQRPVVPGRHLLRVAEANEQADDFTHGRTPSDAHSSYHDAALATSSWRMDNKSALEACHDGDFSSMFRIALLTGLGMLINTGLATAQTTQNIDGNVPIFCLDETGTPQRMIRTTYGNLQEGFARQFNWGHSLRTPSNTQGILEFSAGGSSPDRERITYEVLPYNGGIALIRMHVRFQGKSENPAGAKMCGMTTLIANMAGPGPGVVSGSTPAPSSGPPPSSGQKEAVFSDYPAPVYRGRPKMPDFNGRDRDYASFRTRIRDGLNAGPNFAGHYALIQFGCGTGCSATMVADAITGQIYRFPLSGEEYSQLDLKFAPTSNLVVGRWMAGERCMSESLLWDGRGFKSLRKADIGGEAACN